jgi:hypothetical protein
MRRSLKFVLAFCGIVTFASHADAARLYFTTSNTVPGGGAPKAGVPEISLTPGQTADLYVWVDLASDGSGGDGPDQFMAGYGLDILAGTAGVVEAVSSQIYNPTLTAFGNPFQPRWSGGFGNPVVNPDGAGSAALATNARGFSVNPTGAAGIYANGVSVPPGGFFPVGDPLYDATNTVWLAQHIQIKARDVGPGLHTTGLSMAVGANAFSVDNSAGVEYIYFGNSDERISNGAVGAKTAAPQALITVDGGTVGRTNVFELGGDPTGATSVPFAGVQPVDLPIGSPAGKLLIDDAWLRNGNFEVYFDLSFSDPGTDVNDVIALLQGQSIDALPGRSLGNGIAYDLRIVVPGTPGNDLLLDFDFSAGGLAGVSVESVGVPEPSTFVLAGLGCVGLLAFRRRKA